MTIFVIITYKLDFSNEVIKYFKSQNSCNGFKLHLLPVGLDEGEENDILENINRQLDEIESKKNVVIFSDAGFPTKFAKRITLKDDKVKLYRSKGALIENGFLSYVMLNTQSPDETIEKILEVKIDK